MLLGITSSAFTGATSSLPPVFLSTTLTPTAGLVTSHSVNYPATVNVGDLLILGFSAGAAVGAPTISTPSGWSLLNTHSDSPGILVAYRIADGSEGGDTFVVSTSVGVHGMGAVIRIKAGTFDSGKPPEFTSGDPSWGLAATTMWLSIAAIGRDSTVTDYPYADHHSYQATTGGSSSDRCAIGVCTEVREDVGSGVWTLSVNFGIAEGFIAVCPAVLPPLELTGTFPDGVVGEMYDYTPTRLHGVGPFTFSVESGALPDGLSIDSSTGQVSGIPEVADTFSFTIRVTDDNADTADLPVDVDVTLATLAMNDNGNNVGLVGVDYFGGGYGSGGQPPYTYSVQSGALPDGTTLDVDGNILGIPTTAATFNFTLRVTDDLSNTADLAFEVDVFVTPLVLDVTSTEFGSDTTNHAVNMPATVDAGDRLVLHFANDGSATVSTPAGWTLLASVANGAACRGTWFYKDAAGTEDGTTVSVVTSAAEQAAAQVTRIKAGTFDSGTPLEIATDTGTSAIQNSPAVVPSWGEAATLWVQSNANSGDADPDGAGLNNEEFNKSASGAGACSMYTSYLPYVTDDIVTELTAVSTSLLSSQAYVAALLAVKPA